MGNEHNEKNSRIPEITYSKIVESIIGELKNNDEKTNITAKENSIMGIDVLAYKVMKAFKNTDFEDIIDVSFDNYGHIITSTLNFIDTDKECEKMKELVELLKPIVNDLEVAPSKLEDYANFSGMRKFNLGLKSKFEPVKSNIEKVTYNNTVPNKVLHTDNIEIYQNIENIENDIEKALINLYSKDKEDNNELDKIYCRIKNHEYLVNPIKNFIITQRDGHIKRLIEGPMYMDFIKDLIKEKSNMFSEKDIKTFSIFENYVNRINELDKFVQQSIIEEDEDVYKIEYLNSEFDFLNVLKMEKFYDILPFVGDRTSPLSGTRKSDRTEGLEVYGVSLKLNNKVPAKLFDSSFEYHSHTLKQGTKGVFYKNDIETTVPSKTGVEFKKALIFKYMLLHLEDTNYNALSELKKDLEKYKESEINTTKELIEALKYLTKDMFEDYEKIKNQLANIREFLLMYLNIATDKEFSKKYTKRFSILNTILPEDVDSNDGILISSMKNPEIQEKNILHKYTLLLDDKISEDYCVYSYEYDITITSKPINLLSYDKTIDVSYDLKFQKPFSVIFYPKNSNDKHLTTRVNEAKTELHKEIKTNNSKEQSFIYIPYPNIDFCINDKERFIYETTYMIVTTLILSELNKKLVSLISGKENIKNKLLYIMLIQILANEGKGKDIKYNKMQSFIRNYRKILSSVFSQKYTSETQGFNICREYYCAKNAISSLYSKVYREVDFKRTLNKVNKMAIITVSSRKIDGIKTPEDSISVIHGEVITVRKNKDNNKYVISSFEEFAEPITKEDLYKKPIILSDIISKLKALDYTDILFLASSPSTSNMIEKKEKTEMYFMNEEVIKTIMKDNNGVNIYPLYLSTSKVHLDLKEKNKANTSIFVADGKEFSPNIQKDYEGIVPVFQLFSGNIVNESNGFYKKMITYSTIKGIYPKEVKSIMSKNSLIEDELLIEDIKDIMIAIHIIRNDKDVSKSKSNTPSYKVMKNNPFDNILPESNNSNAECIGLIGSEKYQIKGSKNNNKTFLNHKLALCSYLSKIVD